MFCGNNDGIVGYGKGQGIDFETAMINGMKEAKKNLISLDIHESNSFPLEIKTHFSRFFVKIEPIKGFNCWGNPVFSSMIQLAGIYNVRFNMWRRNPNNYAMVSEV